MRNEMDIFHYLNIYKKEWKKMAALITLIMLITMVVSLMQPIIYRSTTIVLAPKEGGGNMGTLGSYLGLPNLSIGNSSNEIIFSILKSRRMSKDINEHFNRSGKSKFWWNLDTYSVIGGFAVEVKGPDPDMTRDIANFAVQNLDKINLELQVTTQKPMAKVLDPALKGLPVRRNTSKGVIASFLFAFLIYALFIFFKEYFYQLKKSKA